MGKREARRIAKAVHNSINEKRERSGKAATLGDLGLASAAESHARRMAKAGRVAHNLRGSSPATRYAKYARVAENCCSVSRRSSPRRIAGRARKQWLRSPQHRKNILDGRHRIDGVGCWVAGGQVYLCQVFAKRRKILGIL